jgi:DNA-3-methyladenine glycosylase I
MTDDRREAEGRAPGPDHGPQAGERALSSGHGGLEAEGRAPGSDRRLQAGERAPGSGHGGLEAGNRAPGSGGGLEAEGLVLGSDGRLRCFWAGSTPDYTEYHDSEWGRPVRGDDALFERLCLEAFQSGLAWITILRKRPAFRAAFAGFHIEKVAAFDPVADAARLMADPGIVRNRMKIEAALHNARVAAELPVPLTDLLWSYAPAARPRPATRADVPAITPESTALSKDLKKRGFKFVGPTTAYALMQATGMVDDHLSRCHVDPAAPTS